MARGQSNLYNSSVGLTNGVSTPVGSGSYFVRAIANAGCGSSPASNELELVVP
ncbi:MAG: hypothetical protein OEW19_02275 [Acidobacteriota bacterium]|nr:hypothetical protein [Acidobacteriota bacterium]